ncbi:MAG: polyprenyl diphosphate synthase [Spirochaetota bacterium]
MNKQLPSHVGIIMDGNGRWASQRQKPRTFGHLEGLKAARRTAAYLSSRGVSYVTFFVFSTENWKRPPQEVSYLMTLVRTYLKKEFAFYDENNLRVTFCGDLTSLPQEVQQAMQETVDYTKSNTGTVLNLAVNYGGRSEITRAVNRLIATGELPYEITEQDIAENLDHPDFPDVDLVIRTAWEQRLSNFLIWQCAYAEYFFTKTLWPDFDETNLAQALDSYRERVRKFGGTST